MSRRLEGARALVIGAGSGIGRAVAERFVAEGASIVAVDVSEAKCADLRSRMPSTLAVCADATRSADMRSAVDDAAASLGGLDILVNCVGIFDFYRKLEEIDERVLPEAFQELFQVNVLSQLIATRIALPYLRQSQGTVILTASSSSFMPGRGGVLYVASKHAVRGCVIALAHEFAPEVRVNAVAPGGVVGTDLRGTRSLGQAQRMLKPDQARIEDLENLTPLRMALHPEEITESYVFLASPGARSMTGQFLQPDGGLGIRA